MSYYLAIRHISISQANAISGQVYGFPPPSQWLGAMHALERKLNQTELKEPFRFTGCAVFAHQTAVQKYKLEQQWDQVFAQSKNPLTKTPLFNGDKLKSPSINEEGKMDCTVSLLLACNQNPIDLIAKIESLLLCQKVASGRVLSIKQIEMLTVTPKMTQTKLLRSFLPGFVLVDRHDLLTETIEAQPSWSADEAWLHHIALKEQAVRLEDESGAESIEWQRVHANRQGYIVPIQIGFKSISPLYDAGTVQNTRDLETPFRFAEAVYSLAEWKNPLRVDAIEEVLWQYQHQDDLYLCRSQLAALQQNHEF